MSEITFCGRDREPGLKFSTECSLQVTSRHRSETFEVSRNHIQMVPRHLDFEASCQFSPNLNWIAREVRIVLAFDEFYIAAVRPWTITRQCSVRFTKEVCDGRQLASVSSRSLSVDLASNEPMAARDMSRCAPAAQCVSHHRTGVGPFPMPLDRRMSSQSAGGIRNGARCRDIHWSHWGRPVPATGSYDPEGRKLT